MSFLGKHASLTRLGAGLAALATGLAAAPAWADVVPPKTVTATTQATSEFIVIPIAFGLFLTAVLILARVIRGGDDAGPGGGLPLT